MKRIFLIVGGIFGVLLVAALVVPFLVPKAVYKAQIEKAATAALQRDVQLTGDVGISVFPRISASVGGVTVANAPGFEGDYLVKAGELRGSVKWAPLLSRRVEVQELFFVDADVRLHRLADGRANWEFGDNKPATPETDENSGVSAAVEQARLKNATLVFRDDQAGKTYELKELDLAASMQALSEPVKAKAGGLFQGERFDVDLMLDNPEKLNSGGAAQVDLSFDSDLGKATFVGAYTGGETPSLDGAFTAGSDALAGLLKFAAIDVPMDVARLGKVDAKGRVSGPLATLSVDLDDVTQSSDLAKTKFKGQVRLGEAPTVSGALDLQAPSAAELAKFAKLDLPMNISPLGALNISADLSGPLTEPAINFKSLGLKGSLIDAAYVGKIALGETPSLDGKINATISQAGDLAKQMGIDLPAPDALERVELSGGIKGPADKLSLGGMSVKHTGALLNLTYSGDVALAGDGALNGKIDASSDSLRALLTAANVELAPGETLKRFVTSGTLAGSFKNINIANLSLALDDVKATGNAGIDMTGAKPRLTGMLDMGALDLSPFLGASDQEKKPKQPMQAWSKDPLDLGSLKSVDADLQIKTSTLTLGNVQLTNAAVVSRLDNGKLTADLSRFNAFGGNWSGNLSLDASGAKPALSFTMNGDSVAISNLLGTMAGFDKLTGTGGFSLSGNSQGGSIHEIVNALNGEMKTNLSDGALKGLNVTQLVRSAQSLQQAVTTGSLQNLDFGSVLSPSAATDFTEFNTILKIENGVANVDVMKLLNPVLGLDGTGKINLGGQSLDLRLATAIDKSGQGSGSVVQLNGIPVPVRLSGSWSNLKVTPDLSGVQAALQAELGSRVRDGLTDRLGDQVNDRLGGNSGGVIGDVLGLPKKPVEDAPTTPDATPTDTSAPDATDAEPAAEPVTPREQLEQEAERAARDALGGLFGKKKKTETVPAPTETAPDTPEPDPAPTE